MERAASAALLSQPVASIHSNGGRYFHSQSTDEDLGAVHCLQNRRQHTLAGYSGTKIGLVFVCFSLW